jgi:membrane-bound lytic murein transglycosylase D
MPHRSSPFRDRSSAPFGRRQAASLAIAGLLGAAWIGGSAKGTQRIDPNTGVAATAALDAGTAAAVEASWDLPNLDHERVDFFVDRFTDGARDRFENWLALKGKYGPMISAKLAERDMPQDLIYLAMIESGFDSKAYSHAHASGLWQFIEETGKRYGLRVDRWVDERNDPVKATDAALDYLEVLYDRFGSWYLAAAAYNTGENRVGRIMREETGSERGTEESYYLIWHRLPRETRDYVPLMVAAARVSKDPVRYGMDHVQPLPPLAYEEVPVDAATPLAAVAEAAGIDLDALRSLNTHLKGNVTAQGRRTVVRLPEGKRTAFLVSWPEVRERSAVAATPYRVRSGETLLAIARQHGVTVAQIQQENALRGDRIRAGQTLSIPGSGR